MFAQHEFDIRHLGRERIIALAERLALPFKLDDRVARVLDDHDAGSKRAIHKLLFRQIVERRVFVRIVV